MNRSQSNVKSIRIVIPIDASCHFGYTDSLALDNKASRLALGAGCGERTAGTEIPDSPFP